MLDDNHKDILCDGYNPIIDSSWEEPHIGKWLAIAIGIAIVVLLVLFWPGVSHAEQDYSAVEVCDAIYRAEGGAKAQYYYGIRSVKYDNLAEAQQICLNTVRNNKKRWANAGKQEPFLEFLARRYCPIGASNDPHGLNKNWLKNIKWFINHKDGA